MSVKIIKKHVTTHGVIAAVSQKSFRVGSTNETLITIMIHHCLTLRSEKSCSRADGIVNCAGASFNMLVTRLQQAKNVIVSYARVSRRDLFRSSNRQSLNHKNTISTCCVRYKAFAQTITSRYIKPLKTKVIICLNLIFAVNDNNVLPLSSRLPLLH